MFQRAIRLDPVHAMKSYADLVKTYRMMGQYEKALAVYEDISSNLQGHMDLHLDLIACYTALGKKENADTEVSNFLKKVPDFSLTRFSSRFPSKDEAGKAYFIDLLKRAGLPE
jgi:tetratricopeptide (TPR) repeat protein